MASRFFQLPQEIRDQIYDIALADQCVWFSERALRFHLVHRDNRKHCSSCCRSNGEERQWMYASKQLREEVVLCVYRHMHCDKYDINESGRSSSVFSFAHVQKIALRLDVEFDVKYAGETDRKRGVLRPAASSQRKIYHFDRNLERILSHAKSLKHISLRKLDLVLNYSGSYPGSYWAVTAPYTSIDDLDGWEVDLSLLETLGNELQHVNIRTEEIEIHWDDNMTVKAVIMTLPLLQEELARVAAKLVGVNCSLVDQAAADGDGWHLEARQSRVSHRQALQHTGLRGYHEFRGADEIYWKLLPDRGDDMLRYVLDDPDDIYDGPQKCFAKPR